MNAAFFSRKMANLELNHALRATHCLVRLMVNVSARRVAQTAKPPALSELAALPSMMQGRVGQASYFGFAGSTSPVPPHTSQRRRPVPLQSLQSPSIAPAGDLLPVPAQAGQEVALCP